ncbi:secondary thiamine-phosphate synthase enzyme YjbQ [Stetteria hydrogenophila]
MAELLSETVEVRTSRRVEVIDITRPVEEFASRVGGSGILVVKVPHTTAAVTVNEAEPGLMEDIAEALLKLAPIDYPWRHNRIDNNAHAHIAASIMGDSRVVPVVNGRLVLGTWQRILLVELDGPRRRRVSLYYMKAGD